VKNATAASFLGIDIIVTARGKNKNGLAPKTKPANEPTVR
jgi:hypothetical protein